MEQKPLKTMVYAIAFLLLCFTSSMAEEKYTANECFEKFASITIEQLCKIAKNKNIQKNISKKVDFVI